MDKKPTLMEELRVLQQAVPGALIFVVVLLLLRGYHGTVYALERQGSMLLESFLGGPDALVPLLLHTLPLAIAAAVAAFSIAAGWIRFESIWSIVSLGVIVVVGTTLGGFLRNLVPHTPANDVAAVEGLGLLTTAGELPGDQIVPMSVPETGTGLQLAVQARPGPLEATAKRSVWTQLGKIDVFAPPDLTKPPPSDIKPVPLIPEINGVFRIVGLAINQLLGFVVAYQPRLFLAAVLAGSWTGWRWQRRLATLVRHVDERLDDLTDSNSGQTRTVPAEDTRRRAA